MLSGCVNLCQNHTFCRNSLNLTAQSTSNVCYRLFHGPPLLCFMAADAAGQLPLPVAPSRASKTLSLIVRRAGAVGIDGGGHSFGLEAHWSERRDKRKISEFSVRSTL